MNGAAWRIAALAAPCAAATLPVAAGGPELVWYAETETGVAVAERAPDGPVNPASVVKLATTLWALDRLGPDHRFTTRFRLHGAPSPQTGVAQGRLVVEGGADPDLHVENVHLVARELAAAGAREIHGTVQVDDWLWVGWEGGSDGDVKDGVARRGRMAERLRDALDRRRLDPAARHALDELCARREWERCDFGGVPVTGQVAAAGAAHDAVVVIHRSNPLPRILDRLNTWSNNDIERLGATLGEPAELTSFLSERWGPGAARGISFSTLSGLGVNRMTPRQIVALLRDLDRTARGHGLTLASVMGSVGCDPGTVERFGDLARYPGAVIAKTGTLVQTDGGVVALAGALSTAEGRLFFAVLVPRSGARRAAARRAQERWLLELAADHGGAVPLGCSEPPVWSDTEVLLERLPAP